MFAEAAGGKEAAAFLCVPQPAPVGPQLRTGSVSTSAVCGVQAP
jgi:hypothetical protein